MLRESARDGWCALSGRRIVSASHLGAAGRTKPPPCRFPLSSVDSWQCSSRDFNVLPREEHRWGAGGAGALPAVRATAIEPERRLRRTSVRDFPALAPTVAFRGCGSSAADEGAWARPPGWMEGSRRYQQPESPVQTDGHLHGECRKADRDRGCAGRGQVDEGLEHPRRKKDAGELVGDGRPAR